MSARRFAERGFIGLVILQWIALCFVLVLQGVYRGGHPEFLHGTLSASLLYLYLGSPILLLTGLVARKIENRRRFVLAVWASGFVCFAVWSYMAVGLALALLRKY